MIVEEPNIVLDLYWSQGKRCVLYCKKAFFKPLVKSNQKHQHQQVRKKKGLTSECCQSLSLYCGHKYEKHFTVSFYKGRAWV